MNIRMSIMAVSVTTVSGPSVVAGHHSSFKPFLLNQMKIIDNLMREANWISMEVSWAAPTCLLLCEGDVGVDQAPDDAAGKPVMP